MRAWTLLLVLTLQCLGDDRSKMPPVVDPVSVLKSNYDEADKLTKYQHKNQPVVVTAIYVTLLDRENEPLKTRLNFRLHGSQVIGLNRCEVWANGTKYEVEPHGKVEQVSATGEGTEWFSARVVGSNVVLLHYLRSAKKATIRFHGDSGFVDHEVTPDDLRRIREVIDARTVVIDRREKADRAKSQRSGTRLLK